MVCVRALIDARAYPYLQSHGAQIAALPPSSAKVRQAATLLRQLRGACLGLGSQAYERVSQQQANELAESWRAPIPGDPAGEAMLATLLLRTNNPLLRDGTARDFEEARSELEALSYVYIEDVLQAELLCDGRRLRTADAFELVHDPPLCEAGATAHRFCMSCGLWLGPVADYTGRCVNCAARLAA